MPPHLARGLTPPRPLSSLCVCRSPKFAKANPAAKGIAEIGKAGGDAWKKLGAAEKKVYTDKAAAAAAKFKKDHPNWKPEPKKAKKEAAPKAAKATAPKKAAGAKKAAVRIARAFSVMCPCCWVSKHPSLVCVGSGPQEGCRPQGCQGCRAQEGRRRQAQKGRRQEVRGGAPCPCLVSVLCRLYC